MDEFGQKLQQVKVAICHKDCPDGIMSAMFLQDALPDIEVRFVQYGTQEREDLAPEPGMLFCDFSPSETNYKNFVEAGAMILDHHIKAKDVVLAFGDNGVFGDEVEDPGVCGSYLAYREVWKRFRTDASPEEQELAERLARLSGVRDTWQRQDPDWEKACQLAEAMKFFPNWPDRPFTKPEMWDERIQVGSILIDNTRRAATRALGDSYKFTSDKGTKVVMFPGTRLSSDASDMESDADLIVGFGFAGVEKGEVTIIFSTRTRKQFDCGDLCKSFGGGGHTKAAGLSVKFNVSKGGDDPYTVFQRLLHKYESNNIDVKAISYESDVYSLLSGCVGGEELTGSVSFCSNSIEIARSWVPQRRVKVGVECLGLNEEGKSKFPNVVEVWV